MLAALLLLCAGADAGGLVYHVDRQDFSSPSPTLHSFDNRDTLRGPVGVYKVNRQEFFPFPQNGEPPAYVYPLERVYRPAPSAQVQPPRLFVPAESQESATGQANYKNVLSLSEYNRRFPSNSPTYIPFYAQQTSLPPYFVRPAQSQTSAPPYWRVGDAFSTTRSPSTETPTTIATPPPTTFPTTLPPITLPPTTLPATLIPAAFGTYSPQAPATNEDDGILPPIPANDEENKPLPPVSAQDPLRRVYATEDAAGNRHTKVKYHSFNDFVEISDEHRELLESFGSIQNNESDFAELPEASPIRRRRNATRSQVFSLLTVHDSQRGAPVAVQDPEQLIGSYMNRLWRQIEILDDMRKAVRQAKQQQRAKSSPKTIVATGDSTVVVFDGNANFDGKSGDEAGQLSAEPGTVPLVESVGENKPSDDSLASSKEANPTAEWSTESESTSTVDATLRDASHEVLLQRDEGARPTSDPRDQIVYLTEEPYELPTRSPYPLWEDMDEE